MDKNISNLSAPRLQIDRKCFAKTPEEKVFAKKIINAHKAEIRAAGYCSNKHLNIPSRN